MLYWTHFLHAVSLLLLLHGSAGQKIVLTNDDGWAEANVRAAFGALRSNGFDVILSAPAENESGTASSSATPVPLKQPCEFNTCPTGSPAEGFNSTNPALNYVNSFPVDAVRYGIHTLAPQIFGSAPDLIVSGPNVGNNLGPGGTVISGTVGAACEAAIEGFPAVAFSGRTGSQVSYTTLDSSPTSSATKTALIYADLLANFTSALLSPAVRPIIPAGTILNVNFGSTTFTSSGSPNGNCSSASDFQWVFTRLAPSSNAKDVETCGQTTLPDETTVVHAGCFASVTVMNASTKADVAASVQAAMLNRLEPMGFLTCFDG